MAATGHNIVIAIGYTKRVTRGMITAEAVMDRHDLEFDSDEGLEAILRRELIEIVRANGLSDPKTLRSVLINLSPSQPEQ